jgi:hypothetical protein
MRVLIACEESGIVREEFKKLGHDAWSCDIQETAIPGQHYQGNVKDILYNDWDLIIAHPPCTYIANSGVQHLHKDAKRWIKMYEACDFFKLFLDHPCERIAIENPIPHKYALKLLGRKYDQLIQPWQYGHGETKATCFWLKGLDKLKSTNIVEGREQRIWKLPPGPERQKLRSRTFPGIAKAIAKQWGKKETQISILDQITN